jgi:hypothetical protein
MYSRWICRSIQNTTSSFIFNRFLSLTQVQSATATKLKEKPSSTPTPVAATKPIDVPVEDKKPIPPPSSGINDPNKTYSDKIHRLVDEISKLSLVDVMDLNDLLKVICKY